MVDKPTSNSLSRFQLSDQNSRHLLELEFDRSRIEGSYCICHVVPNAKGLFSGLASEVYEERICVSIHNFRPPLLGGVDDAHSLLHGISGKEVFERFIRQ
jgi:hypothetical protein